MGRHKFEEPVKEIKLTEELTGSVRKLKVGRFIKAGQARLRHNIC